MRASAQAASPAALPTLAIERLSLDPSALGSLAVGSGEVIKAGSLRMSAAFQYERSPLVLYRDGVQSSVVGGRSTLHLAAAYGLAPNLEVAVLAALVPLQSGDALSPAGYSQPASAGFSQPEVRGRYQILSADEDALFDLAVGAGVTIPAGSPGLLATGSGFSFTPNVSASRHFGALEVSAEASMLMRKGVMLAADRIGSEAQLAAAVDWQRSSLRYELMVTGVASLTGRDGGSELLGALRWRALDNVEAYAMAGPGLRHDPGVPAWRALVGFAFVPGAHRRMQRLSASPAIAFAPPGPPLAVRMEAPPAHLVEQPLPPPPDSDGDGVPDFEDNCPNQPGPADNDGCPAEVKQLVSITAQKIELKDKVYFDTGNAKIQRRSFGLLDQVAAVLGRHDELTAVVVEGHTDNAGDAARNRALSQLRAAAVVVYLEKKGVAESRLVARGYGADRPMVPNATAIGRAKNRRVEFNLAPAAPVEKVN